MDSHVFDSIMVEKQRAVTRFNRFRFLGKIWQIVEVFMVLGLICWSSPRISDALKSAAGAFCCFDYVFDHLVVFLLGNVIIVTLFFLCRYDGAGEVNGVADYYYDEYSKYRAQRESGKTEEIEEEKQIVVYESPQVEKDLLEVDEMIPSAAKSVEKFRCTESRKLRREMRLSPAAELRRSQKEMGVRKRLDSEEMWRLSSEEFKQVVEKFLEERRPHRMTAAGDEKYQLMMVVE